LAGLLIAFLSAAWVSLIAMLVLAPDAYDEALRLPPGARLASFAALSAIIASTVLGVLLRWRWMFWLLLVANLAGVLRMGVSALELLGVVSLTGPTWYVAYQAVLGAVQFGIGLAMVAAYRRGGVWGAGDTHHREGAPLKKPPSPL
jgi:hypothetical protein